MSNFSDLMNSGKLDGLSAPNRMARINEARRLDQEEAAQGIVVQKPTAPPQPAPEPKSDLKEWKAKRYSLEGARSFDMESDLRSVEKDIAALKKGDKVKAGSIAHAMGAVPLRATDVERLLKEVAEKSGLTYGSLRKNHDLGKKDFKEANPDLELDGAKEIPPEVQAIKAQWCVIKLKGEIVAAEKPPRPSEQPNLMPFHMFQHDRLAVQPCGKDGEKAGQLWHDTPEWRDDFNGYQFAPPGAPPLADRIYNGFTGFPDPQGGISAEERIDVASMSFLALARGCSRYLWHIRHVICSSDPILTKWVQIFIADMLKNPGLRVRVALCLRGGEGIGKSILLALLKPYLEGYMWETKTTEELVGRFNPEFTNLISLISNESHHDKAASKALRDMVTRESWRIEQKFVSAITVNKYARLFFNANAGTVVDTPEDDRRFTIADVSERMKGNDDYFDELLDQMRGPEERPHNHGLACFIELVNRWDFDRSVLKKTVRTEAHASHVRSNLNPLQRFIISGFVRGKIADPKSQLPQVIHLGGDEAKVCEAWSDAWEMKTTQVAIPYGHFEDLFKSAYPDKFVQKDYGTADAILGAFVDLVRAEPTLKRLRIDGDRQWCIMVPEQDACLAMLGARNLLPRHGVDDTEETVEDIGKGTDPLRGWKALPAFSKHPGATTAAAESFGRFLRDPEDRWAHSLLIDDLAMLAGFGQPGARS